MIVWIVGLAGAGKTTLASEITNQVRQKGKKIVFIDGDNIRQIFGSDVDHSLEGRRKNAQRICSICHMLDEQGINVICAILSVFEESRNWNRRNFSKYFEVYIKTSLETLKSRDQKGLYSGFMNGEITNVVGLDLEFEEPKYPNLIIYNNKNLDNLLLYTEKICNLFCD